MAKQHQKKSKGWIIFAFLIAGIGWYLNQKEEARKDASQYADSEDSSPANSPSTSATAGNASQTALSVHFTEPNVTSNKWDVLDDCHLTKHRNNDGDSFHVKDGKGNQTEFRLYFVDTPESRLHQYNGERLQEQADYFHTDRESIITVGKAAKKFVLDLLDQRPFRVVTQWENVYGPERKYCYVLVQWEGKEAYLHEVLVAKGLVRIHTKPTSLPDGTSSNRQRKNLYKIQDSAKEQGIGAWGL